MEWEQFWKKLLNDDKLRNLICEMDAVDRANGSTTNIEQICHQIYDEYDSWRAVYEKVQEDLWKIIDTFEGVHLHTSRIKSLESLIVKVITKRREYLMDVKNKYSYINGDNYYDILTDLIGLRLIINYRGNWKKIHEEILRVFPYNSQMQYEEDKLLPHSPEKNYLAELPVVYYAQGDDIREYAEYPLIPKLHKMNYRGIHYIISFNQTYIELQVRTIYDEAWSDCDHNYVYKKADNKSHIALRQMSDVLSKLTNLCNDIGELMKDIYDEELITIHTDGQWHTTLHILKEWDKSVNRMEEVKQDIREIQCKMVTDDK
jgi:ppGpp synthetase/RelA/SpoT-type nucleotidyltranferase